MIQSAFRNLVNTQYKEGGRVVTRAYLTYEEVLKQIKRDLCDEEANMLLAHLYTFKFPTTEQQLARAEARMARIAKRLKEKADKEPKITIDDVIEANKQFIPELGKPRMWNGADPTKVKSKKILRVKENV